MPNTQTQARAQTTSIVVPEGYTVILLRNDCLFDDLAPLLVNRGSRLVYRDGTLIERVKPHLGIKTPGEPNEG